MWQWFIELHGRRGSTGFGANPITWSDLAAWHMVMQPITRPYELRAILALDNTWLALQAEDAVAKQAQAKARRPRQERR